MMDSRRRLHELIDFIFDSLELKNFGRVDMLFIQLKHLINEEMRKAKRNV